MKWEAIVNGIETDAHASNQRLQRTLQRSQAIHDSREELRDLVFSCVTTEIGKLDRKLHANNVLEFANDLTVTTEADTCSIQSRAFPMIELAAVCTPNGISVRGKKYYSSMDEAKEIRPLRFKFTIDRDYKACFEGDKAHLHPNHVADEITSIVALFFREVANRA